MSAMPTAGDLTTKGAKERPILFSGAMVRAIREDRKTQTRRWCADSKIREGLEVYHMDEFRMSGDGFLQGRKTSEDWVNMVHGQGKNCRGIETRSRYGDVGDRLWVRETWYCDHYLVQEGPYTEPDWTPEEKERLMYFRERDEAGGGWCYTGFSGETMECPWRPSIHMPRWASRITLEVTGVRVERLQEISEADAKAEGIEELSHGFRDYLQRDVQMDAVSSYESLWESINGAGSWEANPWVWVIEFKRLEEARA